jgi:YfiH family protein
VPFELNLAPETRGELRVYPVEGAMNFGVDAFVTDRSGGVSDPPYDELNLAWHVGDDVERVDENRRRVARAMDVGVENLVTARQVHGRRVLDVTGPVPGAEADGLVSDAPELALCVLVADCVPILIVDSASARFGVVHAGWRGLVNGVLASAVARFAAAGTLHVFLGPSISPQGYQIGPDVARQFSRFPTALTADVGDRFRLDLRAVAALQLLVLGVSDENISASQQCTDGGAVFFSDRTARPCGRFALVARRES